MLPSSKPLIRRPYSRLPRAQLKALKRTGKFSGIIADPLAYTAFLVPGGTTSGPLVPVSPIIQQPTATDNGTNYLNILNYDVPTNVDDEINQIDYIYYEDLYNIHINPYCSLSSGL